jgi:hypothetical protein
VEIHDKHLKQPLCQFQKSAPKSTLERRPRGR